MSTPDRYRRRPFDDASTDPQHVIAQALAEYDRDTEIPPATWWRAGQAVRALKAAGMLRTARERKAQDPPASTPPVGAEDVDRIVPCAS